MRLASDSLDSPPTADALRSATLDGVRWLEDSARDPARRCADHLVGLRTVFLRAEDRALAAQAGRVYRRLLRSYPIDAAPLASATDPFDFVDPVGMCALAAEAGRPHAATPAVCAAVHARGDDFFWNVRPAEHRVTNSVTLINYYHFGRLGLPMARTAADVLSACVPTLLDRSRAVSEDELEALLYFATHWAYVLSDYGAHPLDPAAHGALHDCLRDRLTDALDYGNVETLGEVVACLKLFGHRNADPLLAPALRLLHRRQNPDGSWGSRRYRSRTHATCVAITALPDYRVM